MNRIYFLSVDSTKRLSIIDDYFDDDMVTTVFKKHGPIWTIGLSYKTVTFWSIMLYLRMMRNMENQQAQSSLEPIRKTLIQIQISPMVQFIGD